MRKNMVIILYTEEYDDIMVQGNCDEAARCYALANAAQSEWPQVLFSFSFGMSMMI